MTDTGEALLMAVTGRRIFASRLSAPVAAAQSNRIASVVDRRFPYRLPSLTGQFRRLMQGGADGPGVTAGSASGTSSPPAQEEGDGTADASTGVPASTVGQQRYGDRHCSDGQQGAGEMPE
jgi:hypothetical protein